MRRRPLTGRFLVMVVLVALATAATATANASVRSKPSGSPIIIGWVAGAVRNLAPRLLLLGGGGYTPYSVGRCWAGIWATLNRVRIPARTTPEAEDVLRSLTYPRAAGRKPPEHWFTTAHCAAQVNIIAFKIRAVCGSK